VACEDDVICGFATTGPARDGDVPERGELLALYVDPQAWGRGVGRRLIAEARAQLRQRGFTNAVLWVLAGNVRAERFYRNDGWASDHESRHRDVWGTRVEENRYARSVASEGAQ